jgi:rod shape-determining protein MreC
MPFIRHRLRIFSPPFLLVALFFFLISSRFISPLSQFEDQVLHRILSPVLSMATSVSNSVKNFVNHYVVLVSVARENEQLKNELAQLQNQFTELQGEKLRSDRLENMLQLSKQSPSSVEVARIIGYDTIPGVKSILIDKGSERGIKKGQAVLNEKGAVGVVVKTTSKDSTVLLLTDPTSAVDGEVRPSGARGLIHGQKKLLGLNREFWMTRMEYLGRSDELHPQDSVVTSGLDQVFPPGISMGRVEKIYHDEKGLFLSADVLPEVDFSKLQEVMVVLR